MTKRMLIDATHAEETRVVILDGNRLEDFDVETSTKRQLKGNIYLAKVVRVEPSLQAAFVEYGGNRHGFLAFGEIHPDYYQIPVADRERLLEMAEEEAREEEEKTDRELAAEATRPTATELPAIVAEQPEYGFEPDTADAAIPSVEPAEPAVTDVFAADLPMGSGVGIRAAAPDPNDAGNATAPVEIATEQSAQNAEEEQNAQEETAQSDEDASSRRARPLAIESETISGAFETTASPDEAEQDIPRQSAAHETAELSVQTPGSGPQEEAEARLDTGDACAETPPPETVGGEAETGDEQRERRIAPRYLRNYKIQEVIKRRQIMLVQVVKEERGTKGAALTTYLSLAGRYCVLMPNSPRGGGISRKITSAADRRRLKDIIGELDVPKGMGLIVRTAGANRPKSEIKRDSEYLMRLWDDIRDQTLKSVAPALVYEEASLIKRAIRDVYSRDIDEIQVDGEDGWRAVHEFMRMLMPAHAKKVQLWRNGGQPLFAHYQVEAQLDAMLQPIVQLRSGGYLVINQAEALVAIDVNSGRSTRERNVEETALRTNVEAADELARQLRLRDLAGLIVIDFIDMDSKKHNAMVERRLKDALKLDRARIQIGHISHFGLLEMSRQRLRPSLAETSFILCPHCGGTGHVRSTESAAIHVLRGVEDEASRRRAAEITVHVSAPVALYILNHKRDRLREIELRYAMRTIILGEDTQGGSQYRIERTRPQPTHAAATAITPESAQPVPEAEDTAPPDTGVPPGLVEADSEEEPAEPANRVEAETDTFETNLEKGERRRRRRRRRRGARRDDPAAPLGEQPSSDGEGVEEPAPEDEAALDSHIEGVPEHAETAKEAEPAPRRGRRSGRRRRFGPDEDAISPYAAPGAEQPDMTTGYVGPTPANPFGEQAFDIFDVLEEQAQAANRPMPQASETTPAEPEPDPQGSGASIKADVAETGSSEPEAQARPAVALEPPPNAADVGGEPPAAGLPPNPADFGGEPLAAGVPPHFADAGGEPPAAAEVPANPVDIGAEPPAAEVPPHLADAGGEPPAAEVPPHFADAGGEPPAAGVPANFADAGCEPPAAAVPPNFADAGGGPPAAAVRMDPADVGGEPPAAGVPANPADADVRGEPAVKPIVVGSDAEPLGEKKRGWWRR